MVIKAITVHVKPGHLSEYLAAQRVWNSETRLAAGYLGEFVGHDPNEPDTIHLHLRWRSRADLERFMAEDHDRIAAQARADEHYERIDVRILDELPPN